MSELIRQRTRRNLKLDFFRGLALLIIFVNHVPSNELIFYTPSRYGLSDAAEIFVFLSGYAAAIAYGKSFATSGMWLGSVRVFYRCAQIYAAHLSLFFLMAALCVIANTLFGTPDYINRLNIQYFFDHTQEALLGLVFLRYVPNYFDILPMYLVIMLWIPVVLALSRWHVGLALAFPVALYLAMWGLGLELPADWHGDRPWYFNPFGWQLVFFTGFAFGQGWLKPPPSKAWLIAACGLLLLVFLPLGPEPALRPSAWLRQLYEDSRPWLDKTQFGPLRWLHFLALAYLVHVFLRGRSHWMEAKAAQPLVCMGQQSLPLFVLVMMASYVGGMIFDRFGHGMSGLLLVHLGEGALLLGAGRGIAWLKSSPWKSQHRAPESGISLHVLWSRNAAVTALAGVLAMAPLAFAKKRAETLNPAPEPAETLVSAESYPPEAGADLVFEAPKEREPP